ncbi:MAG: lysylphosphatidylglycerol synthase transmembrane domain-containing protein [Candidatus Zixiibacteriota bacterium]
MKINKVLYRIAQGIILIIIFYFLGRSLFLNWSKVKTYHWELDYPLLLGSFILLLLVYLFIIKVWHSLLEKVGAKLSFRNLFKIWFMSNLGKYLPGKVWTVVGMIYLLEKKGVSKRKGFTTAIIGQALAVLSALLLSFILLGYSLYEQMFSNNPIGFFLILFFSIAILIFIAYPKLLEIVVNLGLSLVKKEKISLELKTRELFLYLFYYTLVWFLYGLAFMVFVNAIVPVPWSQYFSLTAAFAFSYTLGFLAVFVPGGLGVREGILVLLLSLYFPLPVATLIALFSRLWMSAVELLGLLVSLRL